MPVSKSEAVSRLSVAFDRCHGDHIPLSDETATALGLKSKSISKADASKLIDANATPSEDAEEEDTPKPAKTKRKTKATEEPPEPPAPPSGEDQLS